MQTQIPLWQFNKFTNNCESFLNSENHSLPNKFSLTVYNILFQLPEYAVSSDTLHFFNNITEFPEDLINNIQNILNLWKGYWYVLYSRDS